MSSLDFLKAEMERKKKQIESVNVMKDGKKFFKRGDLAAKQEEEYWKKQKRFKPAVEEEKQRDSSPAPDSDREEPKPRKEVKISRKEVIKRLRDRQEPIRLFGETDEESLQRLKRLEVEMPDINKGYKNDFMAAMNSVDKEYNESILRCFNDEEADKKAIKTADVDVRKEADNWDSIQADSEKFGRSNSKFDSQLILRYLKLVLWKWGSQLNDRRTEEKVSNQGKIISATHRQTVDYIKPLFKKLQSNGLDEDLLSCLVDIVKHLLKRNYIKANDAYVEMAIGNAPWPIGVTMVGIHARTGREKISAKNIAHVLNDETQRKYIQALKRLMTQAQKFYPTDPARSVNYERSEND